MPVLPTPQPSETDVGQHMNYYILFVLITTADNLAATLSRHRPGETQPYQGQVQSQRSSVI
eukprot:1194825-Prorocentrum_minimum.AAC.7